MNNLWVVNRDRGYVGNVDDDYKSFPQRCIYNNITKNNLDSLPFQLQWLYIECSFLQWLYIQLRMLISTVVNIFNYEMFISTAAR